MDERPAKRARLLSDDESSSDGGVNVWEERQNGPKTAGNALKINEAYAKRFEHNQKRAERHRLEEKYSSRPANGKQYGETSKHQSDDAASDESSSDSKSEDEGNLATEKLDSEIHATLNAIRSKDPRVYDKNSTFYSPLDATQNGESTDAKKEKPMFLRDYHRKNLLEDVKMEPEEQKIGLTPAQEEAKLKADVIAQMHEADINSRDDGENEDFLVAKPKDQHQGFSEEKNDSIPDPSAADIDPDGYLNSLMNSRAWLPNESTRPHPFESDDDSEEARADEFEEAFNLRFEDPSRANEKLLSHSRQAAAKHSVRRESPKGRKRARQSEKAKKDGKRAQRDDERRRLRQLRLEEAQERLRLFKEAAGDLGKDVDEGEWMDFLEKGFEGEDWEKEMRKRFGEEYYSAKGLDDDDDDVRANRHQKSKKREKKKIKKPKWDQDIDIGDIVPDFSHGQQQFTLSDAEEVAKDEDEAENGAYVAKTKASLKKAKKQAARDRQQAELESQTERSKINSLVDESLVADALGTTSSALPSSKSQGSFHYRDTSPTAFGLSAHEILMADDSQLNQYAGLKKLAAFRDEDKKQKDRQRLKAGGKKGRLREWRKQVFGDKAGPTKDWSDFMKEKFGDKSKSEDDGMSGFNDEVNLHGEVNRAAVKKKKSKRSRKKKAQSISE